MKKAKTKKKFLPDNVIELMFGLGASIVIIGALLKITHQDLGPITGDLMLSIGLITAVSYTHLTLPTIYSV